jgi:hypothetical protein
VRLIDAIIRSGHLSERALVEVVMTGDRPAHLDRCDICAERAVELGHWLDDLRTTGIEAADAAFPAERLAAQQAQILRRLEQLDQPARVIAFPSQYRLARETGGRRVAPAWLGVAAAAGLVLGVVGGQMTARMSGHPAVAPPAGQSTQSGSAETPREADAGTAPASTDPALLDEQDRPDLPSFSALAGMTPRQAPVVLVSLRSSSR